MLEENNNSTALQAHVNEVSVVGGQQDTHVITSITWSIFYIMLLLSAIKENVFVVSSGYVLSPSLFSQFMLFQVA